MDLRGLVYFSSLWKIQHSKRKGLVFLTPKLEAPFSRSVSGCFENVGHGRRDDGRGIACPGHWGKSSAADRRDCGRCLYLGGRFGLHTLSRIHRFEIAPRYLRSLRPGQLLPSLGRGG